MAALFDSSMTMSTIEYEHLSMMWMRLATITCDDYIPIDFAATDLVDASWAVVTTPEWMRNPNSN